MNFPLSGSGLLIACNVFILTMLGNVWRRRVPGLGFTESIRTALYLFRYAMALEYYGMRRAEINSYVEALRADLISAPSVEVPGMIRRLGPPRTLAAEVAKGELRPSPLRGVAWLGVVALGTLLLHMLLAEAFLGGFEPLAHPGQHGQWSFLGFSADATMGSGGHANSVAFGGLWLIVAPVIAFVIGSRSWRLLIRSTSSTPSSARG